VVAVLMRAGTGLAGNGIVQGVGAVGPEKGAALCLRRHVVLADGGLLAGWPCACDWILLGTGFLSELPL
jgi:hypothetical protein